MGLCPDALVTHAIFLFCLQSCVAVTLLSNSKSSSVKKSGFGESFQNGWLSGGWFACFGAPISKSLTKVAKATWWEWQCYSSIGLTLWFYPSPVQTSPCPQIPPASPIPHIEISVCSELCDIVMPPRPLLQCENGSSCFYKDFPRSLLFGEAAHGEAYISLCGNGVGGLFCFVFSPWLHEQLKPVTYRSWKLHAEN